MAASDRASRTSDRYREIATTSTHHPRARVIRSAADRGHRKPLSTAQAPGREPGLSQRELAGELGISFGKANYCVRAPIDRGWVKMMNFGRSGHKAAYLYKLTPKGISEKARAAHRFLDRKLEEQERLTNEIEALRKELLTAGDRPE